MEAHAEFGHRSNDIVSGILHIIGAGLSIAILAILVVYGAKIGGPWHIVGYAIFGAGLTLLYLASAFYHLIPHHRVRTKRVFQILDHAMIFVLIAATYTPVLFLALPAGWRWSIFGVVWGLALVGILIKTTRVHFPTVLQNILYLVMGWVIVVALSPLREHMSALALWLLFFGGVSYTVGVVFFALDDLLRKRKYFWMHEIFHVFVMGGSTLHILVMFLLL